MAASPERKRASRYQRNNTSKPIVGLTPIKRKLLRFLAECRVLSLPQLVDLGGLSVKGTQRQMRQLFDAGLVEVVAVPRAALAPDDAPTDASLLYGSAPNLYVPNMRAVRLLVESGLLEERYLNRHYQTYSPKNGMFLRHELLVRDVRVWLERLSVSGAGRVLRWEDGTDAALDLGEEIGISVKPDAWLAFEIPLAERVAVLVGLVEVDRGTERGKTRWSEKVFRYRKLFSSGKLSELTGYQNARVLVLCPDQARCERLTSLILELADDVGIAGKFWISSQGHLREAMLESQLWHVPGSNGLQRIL